MAQDPYKGIQLDLKRSGINPAVPERISWRALECPARPKAMSSPRGERPYWRETCCREFSKASWCSECDREQHVDIRYGCVCVGVYVCVCVCVCVCVYVSETKKEILCNSSTNLWVWNHVNVIPNAINEVIRHPKTAEGEKELNHY